MYIYPGIVSFLLRVFGKQGLVLSKGAFIIRRLFLGHCLNFISKGDLSGRYDEYLPVNGHLSEELNPGRKITQLRDHLGL